MKAIVKASEPGFDSIHYKATIKVGNERARTFLVGGDVHNTLTDYENGIEVSDEYFPGSIKLTLVDDDDDGFNTKHHSRTEFINLWLCKAGLKRTGFNYKNGLYIKPVKG